MSDVQAFAKIALFCDKYRENGQNPESGIDLRLVLKRFFHSRHQNVFGSWIYISYPTCHNKMNYEIRKINSVWHRAGEGR